MGNSEFEFVCCVYWVCIIGSICIIVIVVLMNIFFV